MFPICLFREYVRSNHVKVELCCSLAHGGFIAFKGMEEAFPLFGEGAAAAIGSALAALYQADAALVFHGVEHLPAGGIGDLHALAGAADGAQFVDQGEEQGGLGVEKRLLSRQSHTDYGAHQLAVVVVQEGRVVLLGVHVHEDAPIRDLDAGFFHAASGECAPQPVIALVLQDSLNDRGGHQDGMSGHAIADGDGKLCFAGKEGLDRIRGEEGNVHRGEEDAVAFVFQILQADAGALEHIRGPVVGIAQEKDALPREVMFQVVGAIARDKDDLGNIGLLQRGDDSLRYGYGPHIQHGLEVAHAAGEARCDNNGSCPHFFCTPRRNCSMEKRVVFICNLTDLVKLS